MSTFAALLAALGWDPGITGYLAVGISVVVLCGSVWLLLATNVGTRLGFLISFTGLMGWNLLMGVIWWIYGIGLIGSLPTWDVVDVVDNLNAVDVTEVQFLGELQPTEAAPDGWRELGPAERGDAEAAADAVLVEEFGFATSLEYEKFRVLQSGGERVRPLGLGSNVVTDFIVPSRGEPNYAIVQTQGYLPAEEIDLNASGPLPDRVLDSQADVLNVVLVRNQGSVRLPPALFTIGSGLLFGLGAWMLHRREQLLQEVRAAGDGDA